MKKQLTIENFFNQSKGNISLLAQYDDQTMSDKKFKRRNLSLLKSETPSKSPKKSSSNTCVQKVSRIITTDKQDVISLVSDDEDDFRTNPKDSSTTLSQNSNNSAVISYNSDETIGYSLTPGTPQKSSPTTQSSSQTPNYSKVTPIILGSSTPLKAHNSVSKIKYFSPTKKRGVVKKTPPKLKRNLNAELTNSMSRNNNSDDDFAKACENMDDKTIFLLSTIKTFINDASACKLVDSEAQGILRNCLRVTKPGMRLVCRLYWRKVGWYKKANVNQIASEDRKEKTLLDNLPLETMLESLLMNNLLDEGNKHTMTFEDFKDILNKDDLMQICKELKLKVSSKKDAIKALDGFIRSSANNITKYFSGHTSCNSRIALKLMSEKAGTCYKLSDKARSTLDRLYILSYLGIDYNIIREKKLELMLLYDKINRETHPVDKNMELDNASIVFRNKDEFERYMTAHGIYEDFLSKTDTIEKCTTVQQVFNLYKEIEEDQIIRCKTLPIWLHRFTPAYKYVKILEAGIQDLKRNKGEGRELLALNILASLISQNTLRQTKKQEWYAETALIYHSLNQFEKEAETLLEAFKSSLREEAKDILRPRALALAGRRSAPLPQPARDELRDHASAGILLEGKLPSEHVYKQPMEYTGKRGKVKFQTRTAEGRMVQDAEEYCIGHYLLSGEFTHGEHWEGRIVTTVFFLLFWDIVYTKPEGAPGVFLSRFQTFPLDLFCESFYTNREQAIEDRLKLIENSTEEEFLEIMRTTWDARPEYELSGITRAVGWEGARGVARCLGARRLAAVCRRLARDYGRAHSGFPDLTVWNPHTKKIKFVEVKTDSDKPSMKQIQWMYYLQEHGIDTEFCYLGVNTTRQRSRMAGKSPEKKMKSPKKIKKGVRETSKQFPKPMQEKVKEEPSDNDMTSLTQQDILNKNVKVECQANIETESGLDEQEDKSNSEEITVNNHLPKAPKKIKKEVGETNKLFPKPMQEKVKEEPSENDMTSLTQQEILNINVKVECQDNIKTESGLDEQEDKLNSEEITVKYHDKTNKLFPKQMQEKVKEEPSENDMTSLTQQEILNRNVKVECQDNTKTESGLNEQEDKLNSEEITVKYRDKSNKLFPKPMQEKVKEEPSDNDMTSLTQDILNRNVKIECQDHIKTESGLGEQEDKSNSEEITVNDPSEIAVKVIDSSQVKKNISSCSKDITVEVFHEKSKESVSPFHVRVKKPRQINEDALNRINEIDAAEENQAQRLPQIRDKNGQYGSDKNVNKIIRTGPQDVLAELEDTYYMTNSIGHGNSESSHCFNSRDTLILGTIDES